MTALYLGCELWEFCFDSNVKFQISRDEIREIVEEFYESSDLYEKQEDKIFELEEKIDKLNDVILEHQEEKRCNLITST